MGEKEGAVEKDNAGKKGRREVCRGKGDRKGGGRVRENEYGRVTGVW